ncbi:MAG: hypothetical protein SWK76_07915 [Actinomycetota bacterium]|nr:hypothetical protein [Actinomycetota bacterium]
MQFGLDYQAFVDKLRELEGMDSAEEGFRSILQEARSLLRVAYQDVLDIRHYYQTVIRPDVQQLREAMPDGAGEAA